MKKIPNSERPTKELLHMKFIDSLSKELVRFFILDIQNDCACKYETYETGVPSVYTSYNGLRFGNLESRAQISTAEKITDRELIAGLNAFFSRTETLQKPVATTEHLKMSMDMVKKLNLNRGFDYYYRKPSFFGVLTCNLRGSGFLIVDTGAFKVPNQAAEI